MLRLGRDNSLIALSLLLWGLGSGLYQYVWPLYVKSLGASSVEIGMAIALNGLVSIAVFVPGGIAADRYSRKVNLIATWILGVAAVLIYAIAQDWRQLLIGIALMAISMFGNPALYAYVGEAGKGRDLGQTFTIVFASIQVGMVISPPIGGLLMQSGDMRPLFWAALVLVTLSALTVCLIRDQPRVVAPSAQKQGYAPMLLNGRLITLFVFFFAIYLAANLGRSFSAVYLEEVSGLSRPLIGSLGTLLSLGSVVLALAIGAFSGRFGVILALLVAQLLLLVANSVFLQFTGLFAAGVAYFLWGASNPLSSLTAAILGKQTEAASAGRGYAIQQILTNLALMVAPYASGWLYDLGPQLPFVAAIILIPPLLVATAGLRRLVVGEAVKVTVKA